jgi:hypothetical protein
MLASTCAFTPIIAKFSVAGCSTLNANFLAAQKIRLKVNPMSVIKIRLKLDPKLHKEDWVCSWNVTEMPEVAWQNKCTRIVNWNSVYTYKKRFVPNPALEVQNPRFHNSFRRNWKNRFRGAFRVGLICEPKQMISAALKFGRKTI